MPAAPSAESGIPTLTGVYSRFITAHVKQINGGSTPRAYATLTVPMTLREQMKSSGVEELSFLSLLPSRTGRGLLHIMSGRYRRDLDGPYRIGQRKGVMQGPPNFFSPAEAGQQPIAPVPVYFINWEETDLPDLDVESTFGLIVRAGDLALRLGTAARETHGTERLVGAALLNRATETERRAQATAIPTPQEILQNPQIFSATFPELWPTWQAYKPNNLAVRS